MQKQDDVCMKILIIYKGPSGFNASTSMYRSITKAVPNITEKILNDGTLHYKFRGSGVMTKNCVNLMIKSSSCRYLQIVDHRLPSISL
jgi:hypothetical protein